MEGIDSVARFARFLHRERARADRNGNEFSLLVFTPRQKRDSRRPLARLARTLKRRLRSTDEVGWVSREKLGALLAGTSAAGAWKVAADVLPGFPANETFHCSVYTYPSEPMPDLTPAPRQSVGQAEPEEEKGVLAMEALFANDMPAWKRSVDILGASVGLLLAAPLFAVVAVAVKLTAPGPVFFTQWRSGLGGRPFRMVKFRTMVVGAETRRDELLDRNEQDGPAFKLTDDPRVTRIGALLRKTSIDELPQLWNVLKGDMSLVGPRPLPCFEAQACDVWHRRRLDATPGLTCTWQVKGRSRVSFHDWVRMDVQYIRSRSLLRDLVLIVQTVPAVLLGRGAK